MTEHSKTSSEDWMKTSNNRQIFIGSGHLHNKHKYWTNFGRNPRVFLEWNNIISTFSHSKTLPNMEWALYFFFNLYQIQIQHTSCETQKFIFTWFIDINFSSVLRPSVTFFFYQIVTKNASSQIGRSQHTSYLSFFYTTAIWGQEMIDFHSFTTQVVSRQNCV